MKLVMHFSCCLPYPMISWTSRDFGNFRAL